MNYGSHVGTECAKIPRVKNRVKNTMSCLLIRTIHCITEMISTHCDTSEDLSHKVSLFLSPVRPETFSVKGGKNNFCLERWGLIDSSPKGAHVIKMDASITETKWRLKSQGRHDEREVLLNFMMSKFCKQVMSEFCNEWQNNSTTSSEWILKEANFVGSNAQVLLLKQKNFATGEYKSKS